MSNSMRDQLVAQLNMLAASIVEGKTDLATLEYGLEIECQEFVLNIDISLGTCTDCGQRPCMPGSDICEECNQDRIMMNNVIDMFGD